MNASSIMTAQEVSVIRSDRPIVNQVTLELHLGRITSIIGPNGAGKSTLFKCMTGELVPNEGHILLQDSPLSEYTPLELSRQRAVLPQQSGLQFDFTAEEVVLMGRAPFTHSSDAKLDSEILQQSLSRLDILPLRNRLYTSLSGGEQQRTQLARVLAQAQGTENEPCRLLMMDEPTAALDIRHQIDLLKIARQEAERGLAVLTILHDLNLAAHWSDQIVMMADGKIMHQGPPGEVLSAESLQEVFQVPMQGVRVTENSPCIYIPRASE